MPSLSNLKQLKPVDGFQVPTIGSDEQETSAGQIDIDTNSIAENPMNARRDMLNFETFDSFIANAIISDSSGDLLRNKFQNFGFMLLPNSIQKGCDSSEAVYQNWNDCRICRLSILAFRVRGPAG